MSELFRPQRSRIARVVSLSEGAELASSSQLPLDGAGVDRSSASVGNLARGRDVSFATGDPTVPRATSIEDTSGGSSSKLSPSSQSDFAFSALGAPPLEGARANTNAAVSNTSPSDSDPAGVATPTTATPPKQALPPPEHKVKYPTLYDEKAVLGEALLKDIAKSWASSFGDGLLLTPIEQWGLDDDVDALTGVTVGSNSSAGGGGGGGGGIQRVESFRDTRPSSNINDYTNRGTYCALSRLAPSRENGGLIGSGGGGDNNGTGGGGTSPLYNEDQKLTFTSDGTSTTGQRMGDDEPPTVLLTVTTQPVRCVGGMLLIDGFFAFHNSPFLDKRSPPGRVRVPLPKAVSFFSDAMSSSNASASGGGGPQHGALVDIVRAGKEWQRAVELTKNSGGTSSGAKLLQQIAEHLDQQDQHMRRAGESSSMMTGDDARRGSKRPGGGLTASAAASSSTAITSLQGDFAVAVLHEYAGAASPADDWVVQTFQLVDPAVGLPSGPTLIRGYKTQQAIQRRERKVVAAAKRSAMMSKYGAVYGDGGRRTSQFGGAVMPSATSSANLTRRTSVLMNKYSDGGGDGGDGLASSSRRRGSRSDAAVAGSSRRGSFTGGEGMKVQQLANGGVVTVLRQTMPEEEVLRLSNPGLYAFIAQQDLFELIAATSVVRNAINQYRSSFIVKRNLRRMFASIGVVQRFVRSLSRRRHSAQQRIMRDWCALEAAFVSRLKRHVPVDSDAIDSIVTKVLIQQAVTPESEKQRRIEEAWRASRWEIAVAWRISTASVRAANNASRGIFSGGNDDDSILAPDRSSSLLRRGSWRCAVPAVPPSPEYEAWAKQKYDSVQRRVFSYFISAVPLFEAAQRRLAVRCGFSAQRSAFNDPEMVTILRRSGVSVTQMQHRRREVFLHEAHVAQAEAVKAREHEEAMLNYELARRAAAGVAAATAATSGPAATVQDTLAVAMAKVKRGGLLFGSTLSGGGARLSSLGSGDGGEGEGGENPPTVATAASSSNSGDLQRVGLTVPQRPPDYDDGGEAAAILDVLRNAIDFEVDQPDEFDEMSSSLKQSTQRSDAHRRRRTLTVQPQAPQSQQSTQRGRGGGGGDDGADFGVFTSSLLRGGASNPPRAPQSGRKPQQQPPQRQEPQQQPQRERSDSAAQLAEQQEDVLRRGIPLPWQLQNRKGRKGW